MLCIVMDTQYVLTVVMQSVLDAMPAVLDVCAGCMHMLCGSWILEWHVWGYAVTNLGACGVDRPALRGRAAALVVPLTACQCLVMQVSAWSKEQLCW